MSSTLHSLLLIVVMSLVTVFTRACPYLIFRDENKTPRFMGYLSRVLPGAIMGMLVVYCFKSTTVLSWPYALPEIIASAVIVVLYLWKRNTLVSIATGTILYMFLVQIVFV